MENILIMYETNSYVGVTEHSIANGYYIFIYSENSIREQFGTNGVTGYKDWLTMWLTYKNNILETIYEIKVTDWTKYVHGI